MTDTPPIDDRRRFKELWKELLVRLAASVLAALGVVFANGPLDNGVSWVAPIFYLVLSASIALPAVFVKRGAIVLPAVAGGIFAAIVLVDHYGQSLGIEYEQHELVIGGTIGAAIGVIEGILEKSVATTFAGLLGGSIAGAFALPFMDAKAFDGLAGFGREIALFDLPPVLGPPLMLDCPVQPAVRGGAKRS